VIAGVIVVGLGLYMARGASAGKPTNAADHLRDAGEWVRGQIDDGMGIRAPRA